MNALSPKSNWLDSFTVASDLKGFTADKQPAFTITRATHLGMCFGVRDAVNTAIRFGRNQPLTVLGQLVHNQDIQNRLAKEQVRSTEELSEVRTKHVMVTAHGVSDSRMETIRKSGLTVIDATCPLVHKAHRMLKQLVEKGYHPVVIGRKGHVEVRGLTEDYAEHSVLLSESEIPLIPQKTKYGIVAQTTQPISHVLDLVEKIKAHFPKSEVRFADSVCYPTKRNQQAAEALARTTDLVIVVGGKNSNNTHELVSTCRKHGAEAQQVENENDLVPSWFQGIKRVGLTAGTSTPASKVDDVESALWRLAGNMTTLAPVDRSF